MNRDEIMKLLPHRNSMLLLDEAERIDTCPDCMLPY